MTLTQSFIIAGGVVAGAVLLWPKEPPRIPAMVLARQAAALPASRADPGRAHAAAAASPVSTHDAPTRSQRVALLLAGSPTQALEAFGLLRRCDRARRTEAAGIVARPSAADVCGDMTPDQIVARGQALQRAAAAGVQGAFLAYLLDGPDGSGKVPPGTPRDLADPAVAAYLQQGRLYRDAAAAAGDRSALVNVAMNALNDEHDAAKALAYWIAQEQVGDAAPTPGYEAMVKRLGATLTIEQMSAASALAQEIASAARPLPCADCESSMPDVAVLAKYTPLLAAHVNSQLKFQNAGDRYTLCRTDCMTVAYTATGAWVPVAPRR